MTAGRKTNSGNKEWSTPKEIVDAVEQFFTQLILSKWPIHLDPCSNDYSLVNAFTKYKLPQDGLKESWNYPTIYVNPPYGRNPDNKTSIKNWLDKCSESSKLYSSEIIALIPVATNTRHWQNNIFINANAICFLKVPRLKFLLEGKVVEKGAPMACAIVYWGKHINKFDNTFRSFGKIVKI